MCTSGMFLPACEWKKVVKSFPACVLCFSVLTWDGWCRVDSEEKMTKWRVFWTFLLTFWPKCVFTSSEERQRQSWADVNLPVQITYIIATFRLPTSETLNTKPFRERQKIIISCCAVMTVWSCSTVLAQPFSEQRLFWVFWISPLFSAHLKSCLAVDLRWNKPLCCCANKRKMIWGW